MRQTRFCAGFPTLPWPTALVRAGLVLPMAARLLLAACVGVPYASGQGTCLR